MAPVLLLYSNTPGAALDKEQPFTAQFPSDIIMTWKTQVWLLITLDPDYLPNYLSV